MFSKVLRRKENPNNITFSWVKHVWVSSEGKSSSNWRDFLKVSPALKAFSMYFYNSPDGLLIHIWMLIHLSMCFIHPNVRIGCRMFAKRFRHTQWPKGKSMHFSRPASYIVQWTRAEKKKLKDSLLTHTDADTLYNRTLNILYRSYSLSCIYLLGISRV